MLCVELGHAYDSGESQSEALPRLVMDIDEEDPIVAVSAAVKHSTVITSKVFTSCAYEQYDNSSNVVCDTCVDSVYLGKYHI